VLGWPLSWGARGMNEFWYYTEGNETRGPIAFDQLIKLLSQLPTPKGILVWRQGFADWTAAENVREIVDNLIRPPPLMPRQSVTASEAVAETTTPPQRPSRWERWRIEDQKRWDAAGEPDNPALRSPEPHHSKQSSPAEPALDQPLDQKAITRRRIAFFVALIFVLLTGAYLASEIYDGSAQGIGYLFGEFLGAWAFLSLLSWWGRKATYFPAVVLVIAALIVIGSNFGKVQEAIAAREGMAALQGVTDVTNTQQIDEALRRNPSNKFLQMMAMASKASNETGAAAAKLQDEIEPAALSKDIDPGTATRSELEAFRRVLQTAETNASAFVLRYQALLKAEHDKVESNARSLNVDKDVVTDLLSGVDKRNAKAAAFVSRMMPARAELYRAYGNYLTFLIGEYGSYKVVNGRVIFPQQSTADRFNAGASTLTAATKRVADLEAERKALVQSQQEGWERFVKAK
jgi:hypothetical protein